MEQKGRRGFLHTISALGIGATLLPTELLGETPLQPSTKRIGIIGLDTSQVTMMFSHLNNISGEGYDVVQPGPESARNEYRVTAAYPYGSKTIRSSMDQIPTYVGKMKEHGITLTNSIEELLAITDAIMLMTFDGHPRLEQAMKVINAGKPLFINKPFAGSMKDVIRIMEYAQKYKVSIFSSSPTRYLPGAQAARKGEIGEVTGADCYSRAPLEPSHPDFFWYGIHGIEILFTIMGKDCLSVQRISNDGTDLVIGTWKDNKIGTYRGIRNGYATHSGTAFGTKTILPAGPFQDTGHRQLVQDMLSFFKTGVSPVGMEETLAIHLFMEAADESKRQGGKKILLEDVYKNTIRQL